MELASGKYGGKSSSPPDTDFQVDESLSSGLQFAEGSRNARPSGLEELQLVLVGSLLQLALHVVQLAGELVGQLKEVNQQGYIIHSLENQVLQFDPVLVERLRLGVHIVALLGTQGLQMDLDGFLPGFMFTYGAK